MLLDLLSWLSDHRTEEKSTIFAQGSSVKLQRN